MQSWYCVRNLRDGNGRCLFRATRSKWPDGTVYLIGPGSFSEDLIRVLFIRVQKSFQRDPVFTRINSTRINSTRIRQGGSSVPERSNRATSSSMRQQNPPDDFSWSTPSLHHPRTSPDLDVVVHRELVGVRALADGFDFVLGLVPNPCIDHVVGEDVAAQEEVVIRSQCLQ